MKYFLNILPKEQRIIRVIYPILFEYGSTNKSCIEHSEESP